MAWTVVITGVSRPTMPATTARPYSRSANPPPFPTRMPLRLTATEPEITRSTGCISSIITSRPKRKAPAMVAALAGVACRMAGSNAMKASICLSRGTAMYSTFPSCRARCRNGRWGRSGLLLMTRAFCQAGRLKMRSAASWDP